ncbi:MAG: hypothetical protein C0623_09675 [Desulfuromonas sp.]|nr:MAG: hypothetical protein C0623_09675 [Desulfuromonas sp.]
METNAEWEARCRRCGRCCYEKIEYEGRVYYTDRPCDKLDLGTMLCSVYEHRHIEKAECLALDQAALNRGILPADCPYVSELVNYNAPQLCDESEE